MTYSFAVEKGWLNAKELFPLYCEHYQEMTERFRANSMPVSPFNPRIEAYFKAFQSGDLINYVVRDEDDNAVGYSNVYLTNDMHNRDLIAQEDTIFITKEHRNGVGKKLVRFILGDLKSRGVKRVNVTALTDLRVAKIWERMGFRHTAHSMTYFFDEA